MEGVEGIVQRGDEDAAARDALRMIAAAQKRVKRDDSDPPISACHQVWHLHARLVLSQQHANIRTIQPRVVIIRNGTAESAFCSCMIPAHGAFCRLW